ncbi:MAG: TlyA family RNA methyltransferase, partial [Clostridia bacterium]|nr:TlyA family RNA methyltransferase [Clostridia bacterium]
KGVVRDKKVHINVIEKVLGFVRDNGFIVSGLDYSPVKGPEGNIEYLCFIEKSKEKRDIEIDISSIVESSHNELNGSD